MLTLEKIRAIFTKHPVLSRIAASIIGLYTARSLYCYIHRKYHHYPPGPNGLPLVGHLFSMMNLLKLNAHLATTYGPVSMIYVARQPFVFLNSIDSINEIFHNEYALQRDDWTQGLTFGYLKAHELPTTTSNAPFWMKKRKTLQSVLLSRLDSQFLNTAHNHSVTEVLQSVETCSRQNRLWFPSSDLEYIMFNAIWNASFGSDLPFQSEIQHKITDLVTQIVNSFAVDIVMMRLGIPRVVCYPWSKSLSSPQKALGDYIEALMYDKLSYDEQIWDMKDSKWSKHFQNVQQDKDSCLISKFIAVHRNKPDDTSAKNALVSEIKSLFGAGIETSKNAAEYGLVLLAKYPKYQSVIYNELYGVLGSDWRMEQNTFKSVANELHYLRAFVHETVRLANIAPIAVPRRNDREIWTKDEKYKIPKNSTIIPGIHVVDRSDAYWVDKTNGNPNSLCLEAWLDDKGHFSYLINKDKMMGFSVGPRDCAGRALALRSLSVLFVKLILNLQFKLEDESIEIKQKFRFTNHIHPPIGLLVIPRE